MIRITDNISIDDKEVDLNFVRSSGPGEQNVNKVATAVQLRFDVVRSASLPREVQRRLIRLGGKKITREGVLIIDARRFRTQDQNRQDAVERLVRLIRKATHPPKPRKRPRPSAASKERRLTIKRHRSRVKKLRETVRSSED